MWRNHASRLGRPDRKRRVPHAQPRMAALRAVVAGAAPVLDQESSEVTARVGEVVGIQRCQNRIGLHQIIETIDQVDEPVPTNSSYTVVVTVPTPRLAAPRRWNCDPEPQQLADLVFRARSGIPSQPPTAARRPSPRPPDRSVPARAQSERAVSRRSMPKAWPERRTHFDCRPATIDRSGRLARSPTPAHTDMERAHPRGRRRSTTIPATGRTSRPGGSDDPAVGPRPNLSTADRCPDADARSHRSPDSVGARRGGLARPTAEPCRPGPAPIGPRPGRLGRWWRAPRRRAVSGRARVPGSRAP